MKIKPYYRQKNRGHHREPGPRASWLRTLVRMSDARREIGSALKGLGDYPQKVMA